MATEAEELQTKEFLKRADIKTMKKDLQGLREADALKERDKIVQIKTLEEQLQEQVIKQQQQREKEILEKEKRSKVLGKNAIEERIAEKNLKEYATEQERQQIFLFESQRLALDSQRKEIDEKKDPELKLQKNNLFIEKRSQEQKLTSVVEQEKKLEEEQKFISDKAQLTTIPSERKGLEQRRWDIESEIQKIEKGRWAIEKQIETIENKIKEIDKTSVTLVTERNVLQQKILGIDKSLRDIYSGVITREEERRKGQLEEQKISKESLAVTRLEEKEKTQREQRTESTSTMPRGMEFIKNIPAPIKEKLAKTAETEEEQRKKFMQNVEEGFKNN
jgi:hypothetical protein